MSTLTAKTVSKPGRLVSPIPTVGATNGAGWTVLIPVWISSVFAHVALLGAFLAVIWVFGLLDKVRAGNHLPVPKLAENVETKIDEKEPDLTNTDTGTE